VDGSTFLAAKEGAVAALESQLARSMARLAEQVGWITQTFSKLKT
jgi:hypothetical protein